MSRAPTRVVSKELRRIAPRLARAVQQERDELWRGISVCSHNQGFHFYGAGPCCETIWQAAAIRDRYDREKEERERRHASLYGR